MEQDNTPERPSAAFPLVPVMNTMANSFTSSPPFGSSNPKLCYAKLLSGTSNDFLFNCRMADYDCATTGVSK
jgi:hypothetical protein